MTTAPFSIQTPLHLLQALVLLLCCGKTLSLLQAVSTGFAGVVRKLHAV
jgi:hypothetical protein